MNKTPLKLLTLMLFIIGIAGQMMIISPSGNLKNGNLLFWSAHGHDSMWHLAVANEIQKGFPLTNPVFSGEKLVNYHIFSDIPVALLNKLLKIRSLTLYFWILPFFYSTLLGITAYLVGKEVGKTKQAGLFSLFTVYFMGSFGYIVAFLKRGGFGGESLFWASQIQSSIGNPPQILSNIFFLACIYCLTRYLKNGTGSKVVLIILIVFTTLSKIYAGMVILPAIGILSLHRLYKNKKYDLLIITIVSLIISLVLYLPFTRSAGQYLIFEPLWYVRKMFSDPGRIGINNFDLITQHYQSLKTIKSKIGYLRYDLIGLILILIGNLGVRSLGLLAIPKLFKKNLALSIFLLSTLTISYLIPNLFLQKGVATNTSQAFQYMLLISGIYFAVWTSDFLTKIKKIQVKIIFIIFLILFSIPTQIGLIHEFYSRPAFSKISAQELEALSFLRIILNKDDVILTPPYNSQLDTKEVPPPIWDWFDTSYISALTRGRVYFADYEQVDIMGYNYKTRRDNQILIFNETANQKVTDKIYETKADYIYFPLRLAPKINFTDLKILNKIFKNDEAEIWKVN